MLLLLIDALQVTAALTSVAESINQDCLLAAKAAMIIKPQQVPAGLGQYVLEFGVLLACFMLL
jgi:hypothetical protein